MTAFTDLVPPLVWQVAAGIVAAVVTLTGLRRANQAARRRPLEDTLTVVAATIATGVSAQGMWQFIDRTLHLHPVLQLGMFAFIEAAVMTSAVRAKRSMREKFSAGIDGIAVWALTSLSAVLSAMEARSFPEAVFRLAAPLVAAWLWERGMAIERHRATGRKRINWRLTPERILVRLGLAEAQDRTADEVDAYRRLTRIAFAAKKARRLERARAAAWRLHRALRALDRAVEKAVEHAGLADDPERQAAMLTRIRAMFSAEELRHVEAVAPWAALEHPGATGTGKVALASGATRMVALDDTATGEVAGSSGATREVAATDTDTTPVAAPTATDTRTATTDTGSGSATVTDTSTATDTTPPVAPPTPAPDRHQATVTATTPVAPPAPARTKNATDTQADTDTDTGDATLTATANATDAMLRHWRNATGEGRVPSGAELARKGGCAPSYGRRMRKLWLAELETGQQPLAPIAGPVNGHRHHDGGDA